MMSPSPTRVHGSEKPIIRAEAFQASQNTQTTLSSHTWAGYWRRLLRRLAGHLCPSRRHEIHILADLGTAHHDGKRSPPIWAAAGHGAWT